MYGRVILYLGLFLRNVQISKMLNEKRQNEEGQRPYATGSNQAWHRMREALTYCLGPGSKKANYAKNLKAYQAARNGDAKERQRFLDIVRRPNHPEYITPHDCTECKAPAPATQDPIAGPSTALPTTTPDAVNPNQNTTFPEPREQPSTFPNLGSSSTRKRPHSQIDNNTSINPSRKRGKTQPANLPIPHQNAIDQGGWDDIEEEIAPNEPQENDKFCVWCDGEWYHDIDCPIAWNSFNGGMDGDGGS